VVHEQLVAALPNAELCVRVDDEGLRAESENDGRVTNCA